jgi:hypothetical protein
MIIRQHIYFQQFAFFIIGISQEGGTESSSLDTRIPSSNILVQLSPKDDEINMDLDIDKPPIDSDQEFCYCKLFYCSTF